MRIEEGTRRRRAAADSEQLHGVTCVLFLNDGVTLATAGESATYTPCTQSACICFWMRARPDGCSANTPVSPVTTLCIGLTDRRNGRLHQAVGHAPDGEAAGCRHVRLRPCLHAAPHPGGSRASRPGGNAVPDRQRTSLWHYLPAAAALR